MEPFWAVCFNSNSRSPRARKWYYIARLIRVDGGCFELYWHPDSSLRSSNLAQIRAAAGVLLAPGVYHHEQGGGLNAMVRWGEA